MNFVWKTTIPTLHTHYHYDSDTINLNSSKNLLDINTLLDLLHKISLTTPSPVTLRPYPVYLYLRSIPGQAHQDYSLVLNILCNPK